MNSRINDLTGREFGYLKVISYTGKRTEKGHNAIWLCQCVCGKKIEVRGSSLTSMRRSQKSCGCMTKEINRQKSTKHGGTKDRLYGIWMGMRRRCSDQKVKDYHRYGARGIKVCDEWQDYSAFRKWALETGYDPSAAFQKCTLDRIDSNGNYEPENCRWVDIQTQENNRRNNRLIEYCGKTQTVSMWARELEINVTLLNDRLRRGWTFERAIVTPAIKFKKVSHGESRLK